MIGTNLRCFDCRCQGESHKATDKPCQDYSLSRATDDYTIAIISDGHGGTRYFRSDVGSRLLCEVTARCLSEFVEGIPSMTFSDKPYTAVGIGDSMPNVLQQLFGAIVVGWRKAVMEHADHHPLSETEQTIASPKDEHEWEKTYGCTLIAALRTPSYWLAFQVGDGKCVAINTSPYDRSQQPDDQWELAHIDVAQERGLRISQPIPWDDRCFLNKTTSICDTDALSRFRCCYGGIDTAPVAIFLGSDGIDDSFGEEENLYNFYVQLAKGFSKDGHEASVKDLEQSLPILSKRGSQDDMSVAGIYDSRIQSLLPQLIQWQVGRLEDNRDELENKTAQTWGKIIKGMFNATDRKMAYNDLAKYTKEKVELNDRIKKLNQEIP